MVRNSNSVMPEGLVNQLSSRQQFLDLVKYLMAIRDGGPLTAQIFGHRPISTQLGLFRNTKHNWIMPGMIADLDAASYKRSNEIYHRYCANCHGTPDKEGSLPTSMKFASGKFKNGSDPFSMYQTLTRGFGMMQPQAWMVPQQKYDVIHYIREAYVKPHNPAEYFPVNPAWLAGLPRGESRGPSPQKLEPWVTMDYGRTLINTYEIGQDGSNFAYKGIAVRLDEGGGISRGRHWMIFDHDTLRMAAAWSGTGFIDWKGIHLPTANTRFIHALSATCRPRTSRGPVGPNPASGSWDDPRIVGRDDRHYGPLPARMGALSGDVLSRKPNRDFVSRGGDGDTGAAGAPDGSAPRRVRTPHPSGAAARPADTTSRSGRIRRGYIEIACVGRRCCWEQTRRPLRDTGRAACLRRADVRSGRCGRRIRHDETRLHNQGTDQNGVGGHAVRSDGVGLRMGSRWKGVFCPRRSPVLRHRVGRSGSIAAPSSPTVAGMMWPCPGTSKAVVVRLFVDGQADTQSELRPREPRSGTSCDWALRPLIFPNRRVFSRARSGRSSSYRDAVCPTNSWPDSTRCPNHWRIWHFDDVNNTVRSIVDNRFAANVVRQVTESQLPPMLLAAIEGEVDGRPGSW